LLIQKECSNTITAHNLQTRGRKRNVHLLPLTVFDPCAFAPDFFDTPLCPCCKVFQEFHDPKSKKQGPSVVRDGYAPARRCFGLTSDRYVATPVYKCKVCEQKKNGSDETQHYKFRAYDPRVLKLWCEQHDALDGEIDFVVTNCATMLDKELAELIRAVVGDGKMTPFSVSRMLKQLRGMNRTSVLTNCYAVQHELLCNDDAAKKNGNPSVFPFTPYAVGETDIFRDYPGHAMVRHFMTYVSENDRAYQQSQCEQRVRARVASLDESKKACYKQRLGGTRVAGNTMTFFANCLVCPIFQVNSSGAGYNTPETTAAAELWVAMVTKADGKNCLQLVYIDNPQIGAASVRRLFNLDEASGENFTFKGAVVIVTTDAEAEVAVSELRRRAAAQKPAGSGAAVVGVDIEWLPGCKGVSPGKTELIQVSTADYCAVFLPAALLKNGSVALPKSLTDLIQDVSLIKAGFKLDGDFTKLKDDFDSTLDPKNVTDLGRLGSEHHLLPPNCRWSLKLLVEMACGENMDKELGGGGRQDWRLRAQQLASQGANGCRDALQYAVNDAYAGYAVYAAVMKRAHEHEQEQKEKESHEEEKKESHQEEALPGEVDLAPVPDDILDIVDDLTGRGTDGDADDDGDDELAEGALAEGAAAEGAGAEDAHDGDAETLRATQTVLVAAENYIRAFATCDGTDELSLPAIINREDRAALHTLCKSLGLNSESFGEGNSRYLKVSRVIGAGAGANAGANAGPGAGTGSAAAAAAPPPAGPSHKGRYANLYRINPNWRNLRIKYDPRHWMGNFFLM
jgi:hypothetical protein